MGKKVIMILSNGFAPDPRVYKEAVYLISRGFGVEILCWDKDVSLSYPELEIIDGIHIVRFKIPSVPGSGWRQLPAFFRYLLACKRYMAKTTCDYLHCNDLDGALVGWMARRRATPMVFDMHEFYEKGNKVSQWMWRRLTIFLINQSIKAICVNNAYCSSKYQSIRYKLLLLKNYPDPSLISLLPKSSSKFFRIGYHGSVRNQLTEFFALFDAVKNLSDVRVDINGEGPDWERLFEKSKKYQNVYIHKSFNGTRDLSRLYQDTDVLFCGYDQNRPNYQGDTETVKFFEAICTGTPMIMTKHIWMGDKVEENGFGISCNTRDSNLIKTAIMKFKNDKPFWLQCSNNEKKKAYQYDWREAVKVLDEVYKL